MAIKIFKNWWLLFIKGLILALLGLYTVFNTETSAEGLILFFGITALLSGAGEIFTALSNRDQNEWGALLSEGVLDVLIGIILLSKPEAANLLPILIGIWILFSGISLLSRSLALRREGGEDWTNWLIFSIVIIIVGFLVVTNPFGAYQTLMLFLGVSLILLGAVVMFIAWKLRGLKVMAVDAREKITGRIKGR